jgi:tRNA threonylcarbamoyladenosine biosynthesis protein TsaE
MIIEKRKMIMFKLEVGELMEFITRDENETYELGVKLGEMLLPGTVLSLNGDLGAGKTHFTKGIAVGLGIDEYITSPSFTIMNEYEGRLLLYHFDVYRIEDIEEMYEIGFDEYLYGEGVCVVEWGDIVKDMLPRATITINILRLEDNIRKICIDDNAMLDNLKGLME